MQATICKERQDRTWVVSEIKTYEHMLSGDLSNMRPSVFYRLKELLNDRRADLARINRDNK